MRLRNKQLSGDHEETVVEIIPGFRIIDEYPNPKQRCHEKVVLCTEYDNQDLSTRKKNCLMFT